MILLLFAAQSTVPEGRAEQVGSGAVLEHRVLPGLGTCSPTGEADEIVVCGRRGGGDRYRIPEALRDQAEAGARIAGDARASLDAEPFAPCGIFQGQRKCNKADAAHFGYGNGRDPITVVGKVVAAIAGNGSVAALKIGRREAMTSASGYDTLRMITQGERSWQRPRPSPRM